MFKNTLKYNWGIPVIGLVFLLCSCKSTPQQEEPTPTELVTLKHDLPKIIPREIIFGNPDKASAKLSPDGNRLAYLAPVNGVLNVWVANSETPEAAQPITNDTNRGIRRYFWSYTNDYIIYLQDKGGDENWRAYSVQVDTTEVIDLSPVEGVQTRIQHVSPIFPDEILIAMNDETPQFHQVYKVNIRTGERSTLQTNTGFMGFVTDDNYTVRFGIQTTQDGAVEMLKKQGDAFEPFVSIPMEDSMTTSFLELTEDGTGIYMFDSRGRDTATFNLLNLEDKTSQVLFETAKADVNNMMMHPRTKAVEAVSYNYERVHWHFFDQTVSDRFDHLKTVDKGDILITSRTLDDTHWIVAFDQDAGPIKYYLYTLENNNTRFLFSNRNKLDNQPLATMEPVVIQSRDGLPLVSYLTLPIWANKDGRPPAPLPLVLLVHGGPWARDSWGYNSIHQWLSNRGYGVLSINFRGSTGFGKGFLNAGNLQWGKKMHTDLLDGVDWAIAEKIANPDKICIMGGSYGGYATLAGLAFTPDIFTCGVDIVGPSNLITLLNSIPPYWAPMISIFATRMGDMTKEDGKALLIDVSPLTHVDKISKPLLIGQGANDPRVKQAESDQIVTAMQKKKIPVTYVLYPDEGHGFRRPENSMSFFAITEHFLAKHLGGRAEPLGTFEGSSVTVPEGSEGIPGLTEILNQNNLPKQ